mgnify:CR=1 FL=1
MDATVDLIFNCYEKTWARVLDEAFIGTAVRQNRRAFAGRLVVINNVRDRREVERRAIDLRQAGVIDGFVFVEDELPRALEMAGSPGATWAASLGTRTGRTP